MSLPRIQELSPIVINQIAAGEVIERPASVVKELLENSIDAGASRIDIEIENAGMDLIRIADDGCGIHGDDLKLAFTSHATSKLKIADDLYEIGSLGFRGEALASIGSIAQVQLQSRVKDEEIGAQVHCRGGQLSPQTPWNGSPGTRIEVRSLFYNVPVRRKFLQGKSKEMSLITEVVLRLALSNLRLHLSLTHNGKLVYEIPAKAGLLDRIGIFFGEEVRGQLLSVEGEQPPYTLGGYVGRPGCDRGNSQLQYFFVNGRWIREKFLSRALQEAYRGLMMTGRFPVSFLYLDLPTDQVDVNVHPTKAEVRFQMPERLSLFLESTIKESLRPRDLIESGSHNSRSQVGDAKPDELPTRHSKLDELATRQHDTECRPTSGAERREVKVETAASLPFAAEEVADRRTSPAESTKPMTMPAADRQTAPPPRKPIAPPAKAIQLHNKYLVVEVDEGMLLIDQHALHERILYEKLQKSITSSELEQQQLLIPEPVDLAPQQVSKVMDQQDALLSLGLRVEEFGGSTVLLHSYPAILRPKSPGDILRAVVDYLTTMDRLPDRSVMLDELLSLMACHSAVRTGDPLKPSEISELLAQREGVDLAHHCPHGRPTMLTFTMANLDRQFRRT